MHKLWRLTPALLLALAILAIAAASRAPDIHSEHRGTGHGFVRTRDVPEQADRAVSDILKFFGEKIGK